MRALSALLPAVALALALPAGAQPADRDPNTLWEHRDESDKWNRAAVDALKRHGDDLVEATPRDVTRFCPGYVNGVDAERRAFWVGFLSALAKHESTWKPRAVGGGGQWYGLLQILPATAREYGCRAKSGDALLDGADNLSCAIRIMAETVPRDDAIHGDGTEGVSADWAPMKSDEKRQEIRSWLRAQDYCRFGERARPKPRPENVASAVSGREAYDLAPWQKLAGEAD